MATGDQSFGRDPVPAMLAQFAVKDGLASVRDPDALQRMTSAPGVTLGLPHQAPEPDARIRPEIVGPDGEPVPAKPKRAPATARAGQHERQPPAKPQQKRLVFAFSRDADVVVVNLKDPKGDIEHAIRVPFDTARAMLPILERLAKIEDLTGELGA